MPEEPCTVLLVDDDRASRDAMTEWLRSEGFGIISVANGEEAIQHLHDGVAVIVTDLKMPRTDGLALLRKAKQEVPHAAVILVSGYGTVDTAVAALKEGAFDFLTKPTKAEELTQRIRMALEQRSMAAEIARLHAELSHAQWLREHRRQQCRDARGLRADSPGGRHAKYGLDPRRKRHGQGNGGPSDPRKQHSPDKALRSGQLCGHPRDAHRERAIWPRKGAFTGASDRRGGLFQAAHAGTLFIDEIGELQLGLQSKLLRAIEYKKIMPVGSTKETEVDVRLIAATNKDLGELTKEGGFREDLYYRLKVVELRLPPLRQRKEDIPLLVHHFVEQIAAEDQRPVQGITPEALAALKAYDWPGNVRELRNTLEGIIVLSVRDTIELADLPPYVSQLPSPQLAIQPGMTMAEIEKEAIRRTLEQTCGHRAKTANILGLSVRTLHRKIKEYRLPF